MVKKKCSLHLYFSRIILSYAVLLKSRIYFLPVLDVKGKKAAHGDLQPWNLSQVTSHPDSSGDRGKGQFCSQAACTSALRRRRRAAAPPQLGRRLGCSQEPAAALTLCLQRPSR